MVHESWHFCSYPIPGLVWSGPQCWGFESLPYLGRRLQVSRGWFSKKPKTLYYIYKKEDNKSRNKEWMLCLLAMVDDQWSETSHVMSVPGVQAKQMERAMARSTSSAGSASAREQNHIGRHSKINSGWSNFSCCTIHLQSPSPHSTTLPSHVPPFLYAH